MSVPDFFGSLRVVFDETLRCHGVEVSVIGEHIGLLREATLRLYHQAGGSVVPVFPLCAVEAVREFEAAFFLLLHGCYRQTGALLRSGLELLVTGIYLDVYPAQRRVWTASYKGSG